MAETEGRGAQGSAASPSTRDEPLATFDAGGTVAGGPVPDARLLAGAAWLVRLTGAAVAVLGAVMLGGLILGARGFQVAPGLLSIQPDVAACLSLLGGCVWASTPTASARRRRAAACAGIVVVVVCVLVAVEHALGADLLLDRGWSLERAGATAMPHPARMSLNITVAFVLLAGAHLVLLARRGVRTVPASQAGGLGALVVGLIGIFGYLFEAPDTERFRGATGMALHIAVAIVLLGLATFLARPTTGLARAVTAKGPSATQTRRILATAALVPPSLGWLRLLGQEHGLYGVRVGVALHVALNMLIFTTVILHAGSRAVRLEAEQLHAELQLAGRSQVQALVDNLPAVVFMKDLALRYVMINKEFERRFGDGNRTIGRTAADLFPPDHAEKFHSWDRQAFAATDPIRFEFAFPDRDGPKDFLAAQFPLRDSAGRPYLVCGVVTDVTDLRTATRQVDRFFDLSLDLLAIAGLDGYFKRLNPSWEKALGYTVDELTAKPFLSLIHPDDVDPTRAEVAKLASGVASAGFENRYRCRDGSYRWIYWNCVPYLEEGVLYAVGHDVTERKHTDERFRRLIQAAPDAMVLSDADGRIVLVNEQTERLFGYSSAELVGQHVEILVPQQHRDRHVDHRRSYLAEPDVRGMGVDKQLSGCRRDGTQFPIEITLAPLDTEDGRIVSAAIRDITERQLADEIVKKARDDALALAELKSQFVAMVSHEIRTPMNGVIGMTNLLVETPLQPAQRRYTEAIRTSARALLTVIGDILDFSKGEAGKITVEETDFDLHELIEAVTQVAAETAREKGIGILNIYPPELPETVRGDPGRLRQILLNLVSNAVKFTDHGEVVLRTEPTAPTGDHGSSITFAVTDTGIGIAPQDVQRLFEPFAQLDASTTRQFGGTGLGLTICEQLLNLMGSRLEVDSEPGHGSRFAFTVTLKRPHGPLPPTKPAKNALTGKRILVADGNAASHHMLNSHAQAWGMHTAGVADGQAALDHLHAQARDGQPYDVAVIDQSLPQINGTDLVRVIASDDAIPPTHLVLLNSGSPTDHQAAESSEASVVLSKPIGPSQLYNCLLNLLDPESPGHLHPAPTGPGSAATGRGTVLVAEDNEVNQMVAIETLALLGYRADLARNGIEAVDLATTNSYQAILMDCQMPKMDGFTAVAELRHRETSGRHTPVIAMTANALIEDRERCLAAGMDDYIAKPVDFDDLRDILHRWTTEAHHPAARVRDEFTSGSGDNSGP